MGGSIQSHIIAFPGFSRINTKYWFSRMNIKLTIIIIDKSIIDNTDFILFNFIIKIPETRISKLENRGIDQYFMISFAVPSHAKIIKVIEPIIKNKNPLRTIKIIPITEVLSPSISFLSNRDL